MLAPSAYWIRFNELRAVSECETPLLLKLPPSETARWIKILRLSRTHRRNSRVHLQRKRARRRALDREVVATTHSNGRPPEVRAALTR